MNIKLQYLLVLLAVPIGALDTVISPDDVAKTNSSAAEQILETLIQSNAAVNFAFQPHEKRNKTQEEKKSVDVNTRINERIKDFLDKKKVLRKNGTEPNVIWVQVKNVEELRPDVSKNEFFANAYNRVVNLLTATRSKSGAGNSKIIDIIERSSNATGDFTTAQPDFEATTEPVTDLSEVSTIEYPLESINEIAESLINFDKVEESTPFDLGTTIQYLPVETLAAEKQPQTLLKSPETTPNSPSVESRTETSPLPSSQGVNFWTRFPTRLVTRTPVATKQTPSRWVLNTKAPLLVARTTSQKPSGAVAMVQRLSTMKDAGLSPTPTTTDRSSTVGIETLNSVQSFLSQFGVTLRPSQAQVTRLPPWKTTTNQQDEKLAETSTISDPPATTMTSYWKRPTTAKPALEANKETQPSMDMIKNELLGANPIDIDDNSTSLLKISLLTPGCHAEKSVLMLFNKNQRISITIDTKEQPELGGNDEMKMDRVETTTRMSLADLLNRPLVIKDDPMNNTSTFVVKDEVQEVPTPPTPDPVPTPTTKAPQPKPTRVTLPKRTRPTRLPAAPVPFSPFQPITAAPVAKRTRKPPAVVAVDPKQGAAGQKKTTKRKRNKGKKKNAAKNKNSTILATPTTLAPVSSTVAVKAVKLNATVSSTKKRKISPQRILTRQT